MSTHISDEAVEAAARAFPGYDPDLDDNEIDREENNAFRSRARQILEAAAPYIAAQALEEAADAFEGLPTNKGASISSGTYDWFELFPIQHMRDRAEDIRAAL